MSTRLRIGLHAFQVALERQMANLLEQKARLDASWVQTRMHYHGEGADTFERAYQRSSVMLEQYIDAAQTMLPIIKERLAALDRFDASSDPQL